MRHHHITATGLAKRITVNIISWWGCGVTINWIYSQGKFKLIILIWEVILQWLEKLKMNNLQSSSFISNYFLVNTSVRKWIFLYFQAMCVTYWTNKMDMLENVSFTQDPLTPHLLRLLDLKSCVSIQSRIKLTFFRVIETYQAETEKPVRASRFSFLLTVSTEGMCSQDRTPAWAAELPQGKSICLGGTSNLHWTLWAW